MIIRKFENSTFLDFRLFHSSREVLFLKRRLFVRNRTKRSKGAVLQYYSKSNNSTLFENQIIFIEYRMTSNFHEESLTQTKYSTIRIIEITKIENYSFFDHSKKIDEQIISFVHSLKIFRHWIHIIYTLDHLYFEQNFLKALLCFRQPGVEERMAWLA